MQQISDTQTLWDANLIYKNMNEDPLLKQINYQVPFYPQMTIYDICTKSKNQQKVYTENPHIQRNIRRGLSLAVVKKANDDKIDQIFVCRKGLTKFFDISKEFINPQMQIDSKQPQTKKKRVSNYLLGNIRKAFNQKTQDQNFKLKIYKTQKADGSNSQVSYIKMIDAWIVSSKNVSIVIRNQFDLQAYGKGDYKLVKEICREWLKILQPCSQIQINYLKKQLSTKCMIAEYIGEKESSHFIKYKKKTLAFYAIVDLDSDSVIKDTCRPVDETFAFLDKYNLDKVACEQVGEVSDITQFFVRVEQIYHQVSKSPVAEEEEGSVLYFVKQTNSGQRTLSLCKLKTREYKLFLILRDRLRTFSRVKKEEKVAFKNDSKQEVLKFLKSRQMPLPQQYYVEFLEKGLEVIGNGLSNYVYLIKNSFIEFSEKLMKQYFGDKLGSISFFSQRFQQQASQFEGVLIFTTGISQKMLKKLSFHFNVHFNEQEEKKAATQSSKLDVYISSTPIDVKDKAKNLKKFLFMGDDDKIDLQLLKMHQDYPNLVTRLNYNEFILFDILKLEEGKILNNQEIISQINNNLPYCMSYFHITQSKIQKKQVIVLLPVGLPCIGKTTLSDIFNTYSKSTGHFNFFSLSFSDVQKRFIRDYVKNNPKKSQTDAFYQSRGKTYQIFVETFQNLIKQTKFAHCNNIIFIDKSNNKTEVNRILSIVKQNKREDIEIKVVLALPECQEHFQFSKKASYFSYPIILQCLTRMIKTREMRPDQTEIQRIITMHEAIRLYMKDEYNPLKLKTSGIKGLLRVPFTDTDAEFSQFDIIEKMKEIGKDLTKGTEGRKKKEQSAMLYENMLDNFMDTIAPQFGGTIKEMAYTVQQAVSCFFNIQGGVKQQMKEESKGDDVQKAEGIDTEEVEKAYLQGEKGSKKIEQGAQNKGSKQGLGQNV